MTRQARLTSKGVDLALEGQGVPDGQQEEHYIEKDGLQYAGVHLLVDIWGATGMNSVESVDSALRSAVAAAGATLLNLELHHFSPNDGMTGVAILSESHISIHSWPEVGYAALDIFTCGASDPYKAIPVLQMAFAPETLQVTEQKRGIKVVQVAA